MLPALEDFVAKTSESGRYLCPRCSEERKKHNPTLKITVYADHSVYMCHHCGEHGRVNTHKPIQRYKKPEAKPVTQIPTKLNDNNKIISTFFAERGINSDVVDLKDKVITSRRYFAQLNEEVDAIGFVYGIGDSVQAVKWRPANKRQKAFTQDGAARMFFGLQELTKDTKTIIIVEGEADVIALASIGVHNAWSVPNGAPIKVRKDMLDPSEDVKFNYVWEQWDELESSEQIILATDSDTPGEALKQELARRIGLEKCWEIHLPEGCKDVTDAINNLGSDATKNILNAAKLMPLQGVYEANSYVESVIELYDNGKPTTESTGLESLDSLFRLKEGMLYIGTGFPGSGKSELVDQIMINTARNRHWKWAVSSFENQPQEHMAKLIEKYIHRPFYEGRSPRMKKSEVMEAVEFLNDHFVFLQQKDGRMPTIKSLIARIKLAIARCGVRAAVIDPYNYIDMSVYESENKGISDMLSELSSFAKAYGVAIFFIAHPQKLLPDQNGSLPVPVGSHISGSAAWWAKADIGFTVHRPDKTVPKAQIHCWKSRHKWLGGDGVCVLNYDRTNGVYSDCAQSWDEVKVVEW